MQRYDYIMNGYIEPCKKGDFVRYDDAQEIIDRLRAEYDAYRETAVVEADYLRKEKAELEAQVLHWKVRYNEEKRSRKQALINRASTENLH